MQKPARALATETGAMVIVGAFGTPNVIGRPKAPVVFPNEVAVIKESPLFWYTTVVTSTVAVVVSVSVVVIVLVGAVTVHGGRVVVTVVVDEVGVIVTVEVEFVIGTNAEQNADAFNATIMASAMARPGLSRR